MRICGGFAARASRLALFALVCLAPQLVRADFTVTSVLPAIETGARAVDAHDSVAYVVDDGVTAVDVSDVNAPRVIASLTDIDLRGCSSVAAYAAANGEKRLAVACAGSNALVVVDANAPRDGLRVIGAAQDDTALSGISSVVVKGTLAFVTAPGVQRVVSLDLAADASPRILSFVALSGADAVSLAADDHVAVAAGYAHGGGRVTILSYVPSGVMMKVGSVKDGRLGGRLRDARAFPADPSVIFAATDAAGGSVVVVNATARARPSLAVGLQAQGRAAATTPLAAEDEAGADAASDWTPNGHRSLAGAAALAMGPNRVAYVAGADAGAVVGLDATDPRRPILAHVISDANLRGVADLCAQGGRAAAAAAAVASVPANEEGADASSAAKMSPTGGPAVLYAVVPGASKMLVLRDAGGSAVVANDEL